MPITSSEISSLVESRSGFILEVYRNGKNAVETIAAVSYYLYCTIVSFAYIATMRLIVDTMSNLTICSVRCCVSNSVSDTDSMADSSDEEEGSKETSTVVFTSASLLILDESGYYKCVNVLPIVSELVVLDGGYIQISKIEMLYPNAKFGYFGYYFTEDGLENKQDAFVPRYKSIDLCSRIVPVSGSRCKYGRVYL